MKRSIPLAVGLAVAALLPGCTVDLNPSCTLSNSVDVQSKTVHVDHPNGRDEIDEADDADGAERDTAAPSGSPSRSTAPTGSSTACPGPRHDGRTGCFPFECSVGQYCDDRTTTCKLGCITDANCGPRDTCVRAAGESLGRCEACARQTSHEPAAGCGDPHRNGITECFPGHCEPGQYCVDGRGLSRCDLGCVSDDNCFGTEYCHREPDELVGVCRSCFF